jgi:hypothetical protein
LEQVLDAGSEWWSGVHIPCQKRRVSAAWRNWVSLQRRCDGLTLGGGVVWRHGSVDDNPVWAMEISGLKMEQRFDDTNHASQVSAWGAHCPYARPDVCSFFRHRDDSVMPLVIRWSTLFVF